MFSCGIYCTLEYSSTPIVCNTLCARVPRTDADVVVVHAFSISAHRTPPQATRERRTCAHTRKRYASVRTDTHTHTRERVQRAHRVRRREDDAGMDDPEFTFFELRNREQLCNSRLALLECVCVCVACVGVCCIHKYMCVCVWVELAGPCGWK